jgi:hypothetical protein
MLLFAEAGEGSFAEAVLTWMMQFKVILAPEENKS